MRLDPLLLAGAFRLIPEPHADERGEFARLWCRTLFEDEGLDAGVEQMSLSRNIRRGTLRGMHFQAEPHGETKIVRCVRGAIFDVILDLRPGSPTRGRWAAETLSAENALALYVPKGFAHGFQTLTDETDVLYQMDTPYAPGAGRGVRWNDPAFGIDWPIENPVLSDRDATYPDWTG